MVEQCNSEGGNVVEEWNSDGESVSLNSGTVMVEQCGETVDQRRCNSVGGTVKQ